MDLIDKKVKDVKLIGLIKLVLNNFKSETNNKGMPLGNLTSQFFANIYLNELDQYIKHELKIKYYMRYVDDFIIIERNKEKIEYYKDKVNNFLSERLKLELHPEKSKIIPLSKGINFVGFRNFYHYRILRKKAQKRIKIRINNWKNQKDEGLLERDKALEKLLGWMSYAVNGSTYKLRKKIMSQFNQLLPAEAVERKQTIKYYLEELNKYNLIIKDQNFIKKIFCCMDIKMFEKIEYQRRKRILDLINRLKEYSLKEFTPYFMILLEWHDPKVLELLLVYDGIIEDKIKDLRNICRQFIILRTIKMSSFLKDKDKKEICELQEIIDYGYPVFGNQLYYEIIIKPQIKLE